MSNKPRVSVIMAAYNAEKTIAESIESVLCQTMTDLELIIVDDCSADKTPEIAEAFAEKDKRVTVLHNEENCGIHFTRNKAVAAAGADWIAVCDSDDLWTSDKLERQLAKQRETGAGLIYTGSAFIDEKSKPYDWAMDVPETIDYRTLCRQNIISNSSVLVDKEMYIRYQPRDGKNGIPVKDIHEDFACWLNMLKDGIPAAGINKPLLIYRISSSSRTGNKLKSALRTWRTYRSVGMGPLKSVVCFAFYALKSVGKYGKF